MRVFNFAIIVFLASSLTACCSHKSAVRENSEFMKDSVRIEYREVTTLVTDTVYLEVPLLSSDRVTTDSTSHLENEYAVSDASIDRNGLLHHALSTKPQKKPVVTQSQVTEKETSQTKDSDRVRTEVKYIKRDLLWYEKAQIWGFRGLLLLVVITYTIKRLATHIRQFSNK